jgi:uncharacterized membrane protein HdeD (DUF308 family)
MIKLIVLEAIVMLLLTGLAVRKLIDNIKPLYAVITTAIVGVFWTIGGAFMILRYFEVITWSWLLVAMPLWGPIAIILVIFCFVGGMFFGCDLTD